MTFKLTVAVFAIAVSANMFSASGQAQDEKTAEDREDAQRAKVCRDDTARYALTFVGDTSGKFEAKEVMKWANPVRDRQLGVVSLWLKDGRAQAMSTVFTSYWENRVNVTHEFQSFATRPIVATYEGDVKWSPTKPGVTFRSIPDAPEPAETPVARLRQMRTLTRDFSAHSVSVHGVETRWELRMLPQPLYRYESSGREVLDGAVFTFVSNAGTDPELVVLIEARQTGDKWSWQYAPARFSDHSLYLKHKDQDVWSFVNEGRQSLFAAGVNDIYRLFSHRQLPAKFELGKEYAMSGIIAWLFAVAVASQAAQPDKSPTAEDRHDAALVKLCREDTARYTLAFADAPDATFASKEVFKWTNPVRDRQLGVVSIWIKDGRPEALSTVFTHPLSKESLAVYHEHQSLSPQRITATVKGGVRWTPAQPGVTLRPIPDAPEPADTPAARLRQMRNLIRDFSAHSISYYSGEKRWELRMLSQPLYRYESTNPDVLDGAAFTFVSSAGTDPELILLIEARKENLKWTWQYAAARFSDHSLFLNLRDREVWTFINQNRVWSFAAGVSDTYHMFHDRVVSDPAVQRESEK